MARPVGATGPADDPASSIQYAQLQHATVGMTGRANKHLVYSPYKTY